VTTSSVVTRGLAAVQQDEGGAGGPGEGVHREVDDSRDGDADRDREARARGGARDRPAGDEAVGPFGDRSRAGGGRGGGTGGGHGG
jgi:hypothetical protein